MFDRKSYAKTWREKNKNYDAEWYTKNKQKHQKSTLQAKSKREQRFRDFIIDYKSNNPCPCGESRWWCLDFHHTDPTLKENNVSYIASFGSLTKLKSEISKCVVVCKNCHADIHYQQRLTCS